MIVETHSRFSAAIVIAAAALIVSCQRAGAAPVRVNIPSPHAGERVLILAPHVDDEAIGAGGYAAAAVNAGAVVGVVYMTAGDCNRFSADLMHFTVQPGPRDYLNEGTVRLREGERAMALLGTQASNVYILGYPDRGLKQMLAAPAAVIRSPSTGRTAVPYERALSPGAPYRLGNLLGDLESVYRRFRPDLVIAPVDFDAHPDHAATARIASIMRARFPSELMGYLVHSRHFPVPFRFAPFHFLLPPAGHLDHQWVMFPLSRDLETEKKRLLTRYASQRRDPYLLLLTDAFVRRNELFVVE